MLVAARNGSREVGFPVLATTAALVAVMIPLAFMSGDTGRLFREFAISAWRSRSRSPCSWRSRSCR